MLYASRRGQIGRSLAERLWAFTGAIKSTPLPTVLVVAGIVFWVLAIAGSIAGKIRVRPGRQRAAGPLETYHRFGSAALRRADKTTTFFVNIGNAPTKTDTEDNKPFVDSVKIQRIGPRPETILPSLRIFSSSSFTVCSLLSELFSSFTWSSFQTAAGCNGSDHETNGSTSVPSLGEHVVPIEVHWPGGTGTGFLTVGANF